MADAFTSFPDAARSLLTLHVLSEKEGQFLGGICYRREPLTEKQARWLRILLDRHDLPALIEGGEHVR